MTDHSRPLVTRSPDSDISPTAQPPGAVEYFPPETNEPTPEQTETAKNKGKAVAIAVANSTDGPDGCPDTGDTVAEDSILKPRLTASISSQLSGAAPASRRSSVVSFRQPVDPALPRGVQRKTDGHRLRNSSPTPVRFRQHVSFDNIPVGEATKNNTLGYTLNLSHDGYQPKRRSRTMMVGVDQHAYSDYALQWLLEEYAEDGDEIICVHVSDGAGREEKTYKAKAEAMVDRIKQKIPPDCAISIKLEYAVGKLHETFQKLIHVYQPSMLVVGTRGRSLGGIQGLVNTRNSFSKYCLQYSPVPTVVVRDIDKRQKKKEKRSHDPSRQSYASMLVANRGRHEADSENSSLYELEAKLSPDEEAHKVAAAIGLPASFDPTLKPFDVSGHLQSRSLSAPTLPLADPTRAGGLSDSTGGVPAPPSTLGGSDDEESGDEDEDEFEVMSGGQVLQQSSRDPDQKFKKTRLHQMEVAEAAALREQPLDDDDDDDDGEDQAGRGQT